jgi:hypothetical protein
VRRPQPEIKEEELRKQLLELLENFAVELQSTDLRRKVLALVPAYHKLRDLGSSLIPNTEAASARDRIIAYLRQFPFRVVDGDELMVVSGIGEWARRVRELRVQFGWWIYSGVTFKAMVEGDEAERVEFETELNFDPNELKPDQYVLMRATQDTQAAFRWNVINEIRRAPSGVKDKLIQYFRKNVGEEISGEELLYLANGATEWARRVRELRTEDGWPIATKSSGRPDLSVGYYVLEADHQAYEHDRAIPDAVRVEVLTRDGFKCVTCGWKHEMLSPDDPRRSLELHHRVHHARGGENSVDNLITLCNVHHDSIHAAERISGD